MDCDCRKLGGDGCAAFLFGLSLADGASFASGYCEVVDAGSVVRDTKYLPEFPGEYDVVSALAGHEWCELVGEECGVWDCAAFVVFDVAPDDGSVDFGERFGDVDAAAQHVERADFECGHFPPAEPGVGEEQDDLWVCGDFCGQFVNLLVCEVAALVVASPGGFDAVAGVVGDDVVFVGGFHDLSEDA